MKKLNSENINHFLTKSDLEKINETNAEKKIMRKDKRNKTTKVLNLNFGNKKIKEEQEEKEENKEEKKEPEIRKSIIFKRKTTSVGKIRVTNYFSKNDFCYFN